VSAQLSSRRAAITGASRGIGRAIAARLLSDGASVGLCGRDAVALEAAENELRAGGGEGRVTAAVADVTDAAALERFAAKTEAAFGGIDALVCNAGIWGPKGSFGEIAWDEWLYTFDVNVHGVARTVRAFLPALRRSGRGRIVILSGGGATKPMANLAAYSATKSAVVRLGETLAEELRGDGIEVNMLAPGAVNTRMLEEILAAGPERVGRKQYDDALKQREGGGTPPERGAACCSYLLSDRARGITGKLVSAVWDPWEALDDHVDELARSDVFTLRRVVPADRGMTW
jgi:NAD(P)-dependent dehydrogenase (short-subunit alcohol dehydrogenase family)